MIIFTFPNYLVKADVICFREMANYIIKQKKKKQDETKADIIMAASKIIKGEIREVTKSNEVYPTTEEIANSDKGN